MSRLRRLSALGVATAAALLVFLPASAGSGVGSVTCTGDDFGAPTITSNLVVPLGATCNLGFPHVTGNVSVEGSLFAYGYRFDRNVTVNGGTITLANGGSIGGNLTISGVAGTATLGTPNPGSFHTIGGNFTYSGNAGGGDGLFVNYARVGKNITLSFNSGHFWYNLFNSTAAGDITVDYNTTGGGPIQLSGNTAGNNMTCTGNAPAPIGSGNSAGNQMVGQCSGL